MYALSTLRILNARACAKPAREDETTRHCSHAVSYLGGKRQVVLHSAKQRSTGVIEGKAATNFLVEYQATNSRVKQDALVERYFSTVPTGKQKLAVA